MSPDDDQTPVPADLLGASLTVFDVVYNHMRPDYCGKQGCRRQTINGLEMLVRQGAIAFENGQG